jgi:hypothetical protein
MNCALQALHFYLTKNRKHGYRKGITFLVLNVLQGNVAMHAAGKRMRRMGGMTAKHHAQGVTVKLN